MKITDIKKIIREMSSNEEGAQNMKYYCDNSRHLICIPYSIENLHAMADDLGIKRCWFHNASYAHYDIPKKRIKEIQSKCNVISPKELLKMVKNS